MLEAALSAFCAPGKDADEPSPGIMLLEARDIPPAGAEAVSAGRLSAIGLAIAVKTEFDAPAEAPSAARPFSPRFDMV
jgi:hypothetical protein